MGQVNNQLLLEKGLRADFMKALEQAESPADVMDSLMETKSSANSEKYGWLGQVPQMTQWIDERRLNGLKDYNYEIANKDYEATLKVDRNVMDDDQLGAVKIRVNDLALRAKVFPRKLFFDALVAGTSDLCYDGQAFFSASHPESGTNQSNLLTHAYAGAYPTIAELQAAFLEAETALRSYKDDQNELINDGDIQMKVYCSPNMLGLFRELLNAQMISSTTNTLVGAAKLVSSGRLSGATFYLVNTSGVLKPFILQNRKPITFEALEKGERAFMRKEYLYGVEARYGFGYGLWSKCVRMAKA